MSTMGLCQEQGLFLLTLLLEKRSTVVNLLTRFPLAVSLNPVTQFGRILEQTESAKLKSGISPYSMKALHITGSLL